MTGPTRRGVVWAVAVGLATAASMVLLLAASMVLAGPDQLEAGLGRLGAGRATVEDGSSLLVRNGLVLGAVALVLLVVGSAFAWRLRPAGPPEGRWVAAAALVAAAGWFLVPAAVLGVLGSGPAV